MSKVLIVYWSGTGNTQTMAQAVSDGATDAGAEVTLLEVDKADAAQVEEFDRIAFGCPSMGDEVLEEGEMEPYFTAVEGKLRGKKVALFGSYDWGDGQWMRDWAERAKQAGASICWNEGLIAHLTPDDDGVAECKSLGRDLAAM